MTTRLRRFLLTTIAGVLTALAVLIPSASHADWAPAVFAFGTGDGRVAVTLGPNETYDAGQGASAGYNGTQICDWGVLPMIHQFRDYSGGLCVGAVLQCSEDALAKGEQAGITFTYDESGKNKYVCWSYAYGKELLTPEPGMLQNGLEPSPTENFRIIDPIANPLGDAPFPVTSILTYQDADGIVRTTHLFYDWFVGPQTRYLTFRSWDGTKMVAWRSGKDFIVYPYAFASGQSYLLNKDICLRAGLCSVYKVLPLVSAQGYGYGATLYSPEATS